MLDPLIDPTSDSELDGDDSDAVAICGFSLKFPQDATSPESFWDMMLSKHCATSEFPSSRINGDGFFREHNKIQSLPLRGGHFIEDDISAFDADFFGISPTEAAAMDPMQRWLLEASYRALENAGIPMESVSGSPTAVYTGSFALDYMMQLNRDSEDLATYAAVGAGLSMLSNRISWVFNLQGPSVTLDSACSSTAMSIDIACQALRSGSCTMALVAGSNLTFAPEFFIYLSNLNFLSPDSRCYSFDHRANGYARGEGIAVLVLKKVSDAIRDGNTIRAVIRSTSANEDGKTPGITQPSRVAQEKLIKRTYERAGLEMKHTRFFEAHGTGTQAGDPREAQAIGLAFRKHRAADDPIYVGSVKSNIGHLEGASGIAGVLKSVLILEQGVIPPTANFEKVNPKIDSDFLNLRFPTEPIVWPTPGLRRASINSFGFGGANCHIVLDDAYNYLRLRSLRGNHHTKLSPPQAAQTLRSGHMPNGLSKPNESPLRLFIWSAGDNRGIQRIAQGYKNYYLKKGDSITDQNKFLSNLAHTLARHRSSLSWRSFALLRSTAELQNLESLMSTPLQVYAEPLHIGFVFTGQGAQWYAMGRELLCYTSFRDDLNRASYFLRSLGCRWSVIDELTKPESASRVDQPELSQTLCTVLQVALVDLLHSFNVKPSTVIGHSSGEIAAAYAGGYLNHESAWKLAYFRGLCSAELSEQRSDQIPGAMLSAGLSEPKARELIDSVAAKASGFGLSIACINSPGNVTVSGEESLIDMLKDRLDEERVFARKLRVNVAYHSPQMEPIAAKYISMIGTLSGPDDARPTVPFNSTVTEQRITAKDLVQPSYWSRNMVSPVKFSQALSTMCAQAPLSFVKKIDKSHQFVPLVNHLVEIGPHCALQGPIQDTLRPLPRSIGYSSILKRGRSATESMLEAMGELHCLGSALNFQAVNEPAGRSDISPSMLVDLPEYPFDHSQHYWHESRLSRNYRFRRHAPSELLGVPARDWNDSDARWRQHIRTSEMPWVEQHVINGVTLYPGAGMFVMAIEAAKQIARKSNRMIKGYMLRDIRLESPMDLSAQGGRLEVQTSLRRIKRPGEDGPLFDFVIWSYVQDDWRLNCRGSITVEFSGIDDTANAEEMMAQQGDAIPQSVSDLVSNCNISIDSKTMYDFLRRHGYDYGPLFQAAHLQHFNRQTKQATAEIALFDLATEDHVIHPVSLDAILHLGFTALTSGGSRPMATAIPSSIGCLWVANEALSFPKQKTVTAYVSVDKVTKRGLTCNGGAKDSQGVRLWWERLEMGNVTSSPPLLELPSPKQFCMAVEEKPALNKMSCDEIVSLLNDLHPVTEDLTEFYQDIGQLIEVTLEQLDNSMSPSDLDGSNPWVHHYWNWMQHHLTRLRSKRHDVVTLPSSAHELKSRLENKNDAGRFYVAVASNIESMLKGDVSPLDLLMRTDLTANYYKEMMETRGVRQAVSYLDLFAHQNSGLKILEVGGGTGAVTRKFVAVLQGGPRGTDTIRSLRCSQYYFTDVSRSFLPRVQDEFCHFQSQMTFSTFDIEKDFAEQGFEEGTYDILVAGAVLHISANLAKSVRNVRRALKPGGKLIMFEHLQADGWTTGFLFGVFPGWWLGREDNRPLSPNLDMNDWDRLLKESGFSGADLVFRDFDGNDKRNYGCIISTAVQETSITDTMPESSSAVIVINHDGSEAQWCLADNLQKSLRGGCGLEVSIETINSAPEETTQMKTKELIVFMADYGSSFLGTMNEATWAYLQSLVRNSRRLLWVTSGGGRDADPQNGLVDGLARTLRTEYYELHLVTVALEFTDVPVSKSRFLSQIVEEMLSRAPQDAYEQEYVELNGGLHIRRLVDASDLKEDMNSKLQAFKELETMVGEAEFEMSTKSELGHDSEPYYVKRTTAEDGYMDSDVVTVRVNAVSLQARDRAAALGEDDNPTFGSYCAGVVVDSNSDSPFTPGDRVVVVQPGCLRSHVRVRSNAVAKMPTGTSFANACRIVPEAVTAYHALVDIGRCASGDRVLIHNGASLSGQAAIRILMNRGINDIWTTVASQDVAWFVEHTSLPEDHVLPNSWINNNPTLASQLRRSFDVVFAVQSNIDPVLMDYIRRGGRYLACAASNTVNDHHHIRSIPTNLALFLIQPGPDTASSESLEHAAEISEDLLPVVSRHHTREFDAPDLAAIYSHLQRMDIAETIIVNFNPSDVINVRVERRPDLVLDPEASYLIAGGLGGLGRDMARWLVSRGARYLILLSRSGPRTVEAQQLLAEFRERGIYAATPMCDVSDAAALRAVLTSLSDKMPPVKGCIQASMVMSERIFERMEFHDWKSVVDPKVKGSWNLHDQLPRDLDFFILISSMMGILGNGSLLAYSAASTYQDSLARYRLSQGQRAIAIDLGAVPDGGYLVVNTSPAHMEMLLSSRYQKTYVKELCALLDIYCDPRSKFSDGTAGWQSVIGIRPVSHWQHVEEVPATFEQPLWGHMHHVPGLKGQGGDEGPDEETGRDQRTLALHLAQRATAVDSPAKTAELVSKALTHRVAAILGAVEDRLDALKPMNSYGLDSLSAIDVRNWVGKVFGVEMPIFEILGGTTFAEAGMYIARAIHFRK
ncbi:putative polyketide synthase [Xylaria sp. CBS 124048]|nr:putative polyketide synthase [Xylaria sp. CBS 124048]